MSQYIQQLHIKLCQKKPSSMVMFKSSVAKRRQQEIMETNNKLARRLLTK